MRPLKIEIGSSGVHPGVSARAGDQVRLRTCIVARLGSPSAIVVR
jgi:hypothetical protein